MNRPTPHLLLRAEEGMTMIMVMIVMLVATVVSSATLLAAQSDLPFSAASTERKQAYAAAEAGVEYYLYQLTQDNDYWTKCATVPAPAPVNLRWASGLDRPAQVAHADRDEGRVHDRGDAQEGPGPVRSRQRRDHDARPGDRHLPGPHHRPRRRHRSGRS